jgi:anthranilate phosphoribosyltransferase
MTSPGAEFKRLIAKVATGESLALDEAKFAFDLMMEGQASAAQMGGFLMALRVRGETVEEITGGAMAMRRRVLGVKAPSGAIDTCGTGGDNAGTWNISTAAALVIAALGVPVAKHGNRAQSSKSGAADVLSALGVNIDCDLEVVERSLREANFGFLMAPRHHSAMRAVGPARAELGTRTIFNLLGPLSNPAGAKRQLLGVFSRKWVQPMAQVLANLGAERVWVVHGSDGLDEITTTGPTFVAELVHEHIHTFQVTPEEAGITRGRPADLKGADPESNARAIRDLLSNKPSPLRDVVCLNAAAGLIVAGKAADLKEGVRLAVHAIESGAAHEVLAQVIAITNGPTGHRAAARADTAAPQPGA